MKRERILGLCRRICRRPANILSALILILIWQMGNGCCQRWNFSPKAERSPLCWKGRRTSGLKWLEMMMWKKIQKRRRSHPLKWIRTARSLKRVIPQQSGSRRKTTYGLILLTPVWVCTLRPILPTEVITLTLSGLKRNKYLKACLKWRRIPIPVSGTSVTWTFMTRPAMKRP